LATVEVHCVEKNPEMLSSKNIISFLSLKLLSVYTVSQTTQDHKKKKEEKKEEEITETE